MSSGRTIPLGWLFAMVAIFMAAPVSARECNPIPSGSSQIMFDGWSGPALPVFVYRAQNAGPDSRIVFVMHGVRRDGDRYRDEWRDLAEQHDLVIVVPNFGRRDFPTTASYNLGNMVREGGGRIPRARWSFSAIEPLFDDIICRLGSRQTGYAMYGHSAGGQFVHRYVAFADAPRLQAAVAANSGWYTMPDATAAFPYGWGGDVAGLVDPARALGRPLTILLGTEDIVRDDPNLRNTDEANLQGPTRFARGHAFFDAGRALASEERAFGWRIAYAPGVGHDNAGMAPYAIPHLVRNAERPGIASDEGATLVTPAQLMQRPDVARALADIAEWEQNWAIDRLIDLTQIPAPPFQEGPRANAFANLLREIGGLDVRIDEAGNVIARRRGSGNGPTVMLAAHLDTVFPEGTDVAVRRDGNRFTAPGIGDNTRGLVSLLLVARALEHQHIESDGDIVFVGTVGEEGAGDLRGMRHIFANPDHGIHSVVAIDGGEMGRLVDTAVGSNRYRITFSGPGGHSYGAFGTVNPHHATARAIASFLERAELVARSGTKATYSVATLEGGIGINVIPTRSSFEIDLRSSDANRLAALDAILRSALDAALVTENERSPDGNRLELAIADLGRRPAGSNPPNSPLVTNSAAVLNALGIETHRTASSTDANLPMSLGIPSVTISRGGISERAHAIEEYWIAQNQHLGPQAALLILLMQTLQGSETPDR